MKIALIGYGAMGKLIDQLAVERRHKVPVVIEGTDAGLSAAQLAEKLEGVAAVIDFTVAAAVRRNVEACMMAQVPVVVGTTGWLDQKADIEKLVSDAGGALVYGANFSIGVNLFYKISAYAAELFAKFPEYEAFIEEQHHSRKKDAPSGTALKIEEIVFNKFFGEDADEGVRVPIAATRAGNIPGTHRVGFDGPADQILLTHTARSREGFALGAVMAAEWIVGKKGFFEFTDVVDQTLKR